MRIEHKYNISIIFQYKIRDIGTCTKDALVWKVCLPLCAVSVAAWHTAAAVANAAGYAKSGPAVIY